MSLSNKLAITDVDVKDKRVLIRVRPALDKHAHSEVASELESVVT